MPESLDRGRASCGDLENFWAVSYIAESTLLSRPSPSQVLAEGCVFDGFKSRFRVPNASARSASPILNSSSSSIAVRGSTSRFLPAILNNDSTETCPRGSSEERQDSGLYSKSTTRSEKVYYKSKCIPWAYRSAQAGRRVWLWTPPPLEVGLRITPTGCMFHSLTKMERDTILRSRRETICLI
jgi:hypothetical protein